MPPRSLSLRQLTGEVLSVPIQVPAALSPGAHGDELTKSDARPSPPGRRPDRGLQSDSLPLGPVLPIQFISSPRRFLCRQGAPALMLAILEDAIDCFQKQGVRKSRDAQRAGVEAEKWLFHNDKEWLFSFVNICAALDLDPRSIQRRLLKWREQHAPPIATAGHERPARQPRKK